MSKARNPRRALRRERYATKLMTARLLSALTPAQLASVTKDRSNGMQIIQEAINAKRVPTELSY